MASPSVGDEAGLDARGLVEELLQRLVVTIEAVDIELIVLADGDESEWPVGKRQIVERVLQIRMAVTADVLDHLAPGRVLPFENHRVAPGDRVRALDPLDRPAAVPLEREAEELRAAVGERDAGEEGQVERTELP